MSLRPSRSSKRQRAFGAATEADLPSAQPIHNTFSDAISTRDLAPDDLPSLTTLCARVFVQHVRHLSSSDSLWGPTREWLKVIPDAISPKLFTMLRSSCPNLLSHGFIIANFLRGSSITLTNDLPGVNRFTIEGVTRAGRDLRELYLVGFEKFSDKTIASILPKLPSLQVLVLRSCAKVGAKTIDAAAKYCPLLTTVDLGYTAATPLSVASLVLKCPELTTLKVTGAQNWTDANFGKFLSALRGQPLLPKLRKLKLQQTSLSDPSISHLLDLCPNLESLDLSFTLVRNPQKHMYFKSSLSFLQKLNLTSTSISSADLLAILPGLTLLKTLSLGALGSRQGSTLSITNSSAMTLTEETLDRLTDVLICFEHLESISLVGNTKLCLTSTRALPRFVRQVGRRCKKLNLAGIPSLRSQDLAGLLPIDSNSDSSSTLRTLILNNTGIDDDSAHFISSCPDLQSLAVAGTKLTTEGLFTIIDACPKLEKLDLTSCRGVKVVDRRRFFEVWEEDRNG